MHSQLTQATLTRREHEIVACVTQGLSNKEIGRQLKVTEGTVKMHLHAIFAKLGIPNRTKLALMALQTPEVFLGRAA